MEYAEMVERAQRMRSRDLFGQVPAEELAQFDVKQTEISLDVGLSKPVHIFVLEDKEPGENRPMILNFHGGGFIKGRQSKDQLFCSKLVETFHALVWDVDYSLAPEDPYPAAVNESYAVAEYAFAHAKELGVDPSRILLAGHSAGGNLVATICIKAGETKAFKAAGAIMEFCPLDLYTDPGTKPRAEGDMPAEVARTYNAFYCPAEEAKNPYVSPIFASQEQLSAFPDTLIMSADRDSLCFEDEEFAMALARAGVTTTCCRFPDSLHGFTINRSGAWEASTELFMTFAKAHIG